MISLHYGDYIRGVRLSKEKKYWCPTWQIEKEGKKILTIKEVVRKISDDDTQKIFFICSECKREFEIRQLRGIFSFLNQVTIVLSIGYNIINVMMFKNSFKLTGNKTYDDAVEAIMMLWENYINSIPNAWNLQDIDVKLGNIDMNFMFDVVMRNVNYDIGFPIDRGKLKATLYPKTNFSLLLMIFLISPSLF